MPGESTLDFYKDLPELSSFAEFGDENSYHAVPVDWWVVLTDVVGSTSAIEAGKYKQVNVAGGIVAMAVSNLLGDMDYPFVFGGDGVTILVPGDVVDGVRDVLVDSRSMVREAFDLELRVGVMRVGDILEAGHTLALAKLRISDYYVQAMLAGGGLDWAESRVKAPDPDNPYLVPEDHQPEVRADFTGFTCRWQDVKSPREETVALIVKTADARPQARREVLGRVVAAIQEHLGDVADYHPLTEENLHVTTDTARLHNEAAVKSGQPKGGFRYRMKLARVRAETAVLRFAVRTGWRLPFARNGVNLTEIPRMNVLSSDFRKYDNTLKMVVACTREGRERLEAVLEGMHRAGELYYGVHVSDRALTTCLMHEDSVREVHFVDAADGGYALAAKQLKRQLHEARTGG